MKTTQTSYLRFLSVILVAIILISAVGPVPLDSVSAQGTQCGQWTVQIVKADKEKRIEATIFDKLFGENCPGAMTLKNKTSIDWFGGGYIMEITTSSTNANPIVSTIGATGLTFLMPSTPLDIHANPMNPALAANVSVVSTITAESFKLDAAFFLLRSGLKLLPISTLAACGIGSEATTDLMISTFLLSNSPDILLGLNRGSDVITNAVLWTAKGDFLGAKQELVRVLPQFFESLKGTFKKQAVSCVISVLAEAFGVKKLAGVIKIAVSFLTWIPVMAWDYYKYQGAPAKVSLAYTPILIPTATATPIPTIPPTLTPTSTPDAVSSLRGSVLERSNCRYGPESVYLYKYGLKPETRMEAIGRDADGNWLYVQGVGGHNPCWLKASQIKINGDVMRLPDTYTFKSHTSQLPVSPFFERITILSVSGSGGTVNLEWQKHVVRADLNTEQGVEYVIEVWTCVDGKPAFYALGTNETSASFQVDYSCGVPTHADIIGLDKEGFSLPAVIAVP